MSIEDARAVFERWYETASAADGMLNAVNSVCADDCVMHLQNGEVGTRAIADLQAAQARALYPDLSVDIEHVVLAEDRLMIQFELVGTPSLVFRIAQGRGEFHASGAMIARIRDREVVEIWQYMNPGAVLTFPPMIDPPPPPVPASAPGTSEDAATVMRRWQRATSGAELVDSILASALPECLVHATNSDLGRPTLVEEHFRIVLAAFPDLVVAFDEGFVSDDRLIVQFILDGTQRGALGIAPASGARVQSTGAIVARVTADQRVQELWLYLAPAMGLLFPRRDR